MLFLQTLHAHFTHQVSTYQVFFRSQANLRMRFPLFFVFLTLTSAVPHTLPSMNLRHIHQRHYTPHMHALNGSNTTGNAIIQNACTYPLYIWTVGAQISPQHTLPPSQQHREPFRHDPRSGGIAVKVTTQPNGLFLGAPQTIFAYNLDRNASRLWYDLSDVFGDPFEGSSVSVQPADPEVHWEDGVPPKGSQIRVVDATEDLTVRFC